MSFISSILKKATSETTTTKEYPSQILCVASMAIILRDFIEKDFIKVRNIRTKTKFF